MDLSIYVHIPFCESKCVYCAFSSFVAKDNLIERYFGALSSEIINKSRKFKNYIVKTIYFGGGTPNVVEYKYISNILTIIKEKFKVDNNAEITIECNPNSATLQKLRAYKQMGFNRISFGIQSMDDEKLKKLGRKHNRVQAIEAIKQAKMAGIDNISADLLIGIKGQTLSEFKENIDTLINCGVKHFSTYMLMVENGTKLAHIKTRQELVMDDEECVDLYQGIYEYLKQNNFDRYEISNFSKTNYQSKHNQVYWQGGEYLGVGLAAHSYYKNTRIANTKNFDLYLSQKNYQKSHVLSIDEQREERIMLGLRTSRGIDLIKFNNDFQDDLVFSKNDDINDLIKLDMIEIKDNFLRIKPDHFGKTNSIIIKLL